MFQKLYRYPALHDYASGYFLYPGIAASQSIHRGKMKTKIFGFFILLIVSASLSCSSTTSNNVVSTEKVMEFKEQDCTGYDVPARYTSIKCYWIGPYSTGIVYYDGNNIGAIGSFTGKAGPEKLSQQASDFITYWAKIGGWDKNDLQDAFQGMDDMQFGDTKVFGDLIMTINHSSELELMAIWIGLQ